MPRVREAKCNPAKVYNGVGYSPIFVEILYPSILHLNVPGTHLMASHFGALPFLLLCVYIQDIPSPPPPPLPHIIKLASGLDRPPATEKGISLSPISSAGIPY